MSKEEIIEKLKESKIHLKDKFHIKKIALFGSCLRNKDSGTSDIDLLIELDENISNVYELKKELRLYLTEIFKMDVDLAREKYLKNYVKNDILTQAIYV
ncbi:MAG: nucleotidyltransferase domain-containing protein [Candidatus Hydrogenedentota bacterium]